MKVSVTRVIEEVDEFDVVPLAAGDILREGDITGADGVYTYVAPPYGEELTVEDEGLYFRAVTIRVERLPVVCHVLKVGDTVQQGDYVFRQGNRFASLVGAKHVGKEAPLENRDGDRLTFLRPQKVEGAA